MRGLIGGVGPDDMLSQATEGRTRDKGAKLWHARSKFKVHTKVFSNGAIRAWKKLSLPMLITDGVNTFKTLLDRMRYDLGTVLGTKVAGSSKVGQSMRIYVTVMLWSNRTQTQQMSSRFIGEKSSPFPSHFRGHQTLQQTKSEPENGRPAVSAKPCGCHRRNSGCPTDCRGHQFPVELNWNSNWNWSLFDLLVLKVTGCQWLPCGCGLCADWSSQLWQLHQSPPLQVRQHFKRSMRTLL